MSDSPRFGDGVPRELIEDSPKAWIDDPDTCPVCGFRTGDVGEMYRHLMEGCQTDGGTNVD